MQRLLGIIGVLIILGASAYSKYVTKLPTQVYYVLFILGAGLIFVGNFRKR